MQQTDCAAECMCVLFACQSRLLSQQAMQPLPPPHFCHSACSLWRRTASCPASSCAPPAATGSAAEGVQNYVVCKTWKLRALLYCPQLPFYKPLQHTAVSAAAGAGRPQTHSSPAQMHALCNVMIAMLPAASQQHPAPPGTERTHPPGRPQKVTPPPELPPPSPRRVRVHHPF